LASSISIGLQDSSTAIGGGLLSLVISIGLITAIELKCSRHRKEGLFDLLSIFAILKWNHPQFGGLKARQFFHKKVQ